VEDVPHVVDRINRYNSPRAPLNPPVPPAIGWNSELGLRYAA
jgi:hypothetical protein